MPQFTPCRVWTLVAVSLASFAAAATIVPAQTGEGPVFQIATTDGTPQSGRLLDLNENWSLSIRSDHVARFTATEWISLRRRGAALPPPTGAPQVVLTNGDRLPGASIKILNERLYFDAQLGESQKFAIPLSHISLIWLTPPEGAMAQLEFLRRLAAEPRRQDAAHLRNGDIVEGALSGLEAGRLLLERDGKETSLDLDKVAAVSLNSDLSRPVRVGTTVYANVVLANGARLTLTNPGGDSLALRGKTHFGAAVKAPLGQLVAMSLRKGKATYLSELKPLNYEYTPYLGVRWPLAVDSSVIGGPLRLGEDAFDRGLGMHSACEATYSVAGYKWFEAVVGLDRESGRGGNVSVDVLVDGKSQELGWPGDIDGDDSPRSIRVPLNGGKELALRVLFGRRGDIQDHVNWADARLVR